MNSTSACINFNKQHQYTKSGSSIYKTVTFKYLMAKVDASTRTPFITLPQTSKKQTATISRLIKQVTTKATAKNTHFKHNVLHQSNHVPSGNLFLKSENSFITQLLIWMNHMITRWSSRASKNWCYATVNICEQQKLPSIFKGKVKGATLRGVGGVIISLPGFSAQRWYKPNSVKHGQCGDKPTITFLASKHHRPSIHYQITLLGDRGVREH